MSAPLSFPGVLVSVGMPSDETMQAMSEATRQWELRAARGECAWICSSCCVTFPDGMPDACPHGHQECTDFNQRDKREAQAATIPTEGS